MNGVWLGTSIRRSQGQRKHELSDRYIIHLVPRNNVFERLT